MWFRHDKNFFNLDKAIKIYQDVSIDSNKFHRVIMQTSTEKLIMFEDKDEKKANDFLKKVIKKGGLK
ncbi:MAG: hypothetical protein ACQESN_10760 [Thermotogota bacterium]